MREWEKHTTCCDALDLRESLSLTGLLHSVVNWCSPITLRKREQEMEVSRQRDPGRVQGGYRGSSKHTWRSLCWETSFESARSGIRLI